MSGETPRRSPRSTKGMHTAKPDGQLYNKRDSERQEQQRSRIQSYNKLQRLEDEKNEINQTIRIQSARRVRFADDDDDSPRRKIHPSFEYPDPLAKETQSMAEETQSMAEETQSMADETQSAEETQSVYALPLAPINYRFTDEDSYPQPPPPNPLSQPLAEETQSVYAQPLSQSAQTLAEEPQFNTSIQSANSESSLTSATEQESESQGSVTPTGAAVSAVSEALRIDYPLVSLENWIYSLHLEKALVPDFQSNYTFENSNAFVILDKFAIGSLNAQQLNKETELLRMQKTTWDAIWKSFYSSAEFSSTELLSTLQALVV